VNGSDRYFAATPEKTVQAARPALVGSDTAMSVALVTRNRPESLRRTLRSLTAQPVQPAEVVVYDDSDPSHVGAVRDACDEHGCRYVAGPRRGLYANRNNAISYCSGSHVRTMDDDHELPEGHFESCLRAVQAEPTTVWIIGELTPDQILQGADTARVECPPELHPRGFSVPPSCTRRTWGIADGATIYPRHIFDRGDRMAEFYIFGAAYLEWGSRLYWRGHTISHLESTYVIHHFDPNSRSYNLPEVDLSSRLFAAMCHSFVHQRTSRNIILTTAQLAWTAAHFRRREIRALITAARNVRTHISSLQLSV
jgi:glycosyltransferase involved in cell wall biosynthesis